VIKERQSWQAIDVEYLGNPSYSFTVDGNSKVSSLQLPNHSKRFSRLITVPAGSVGYTPQLSLDSKDIFRYNFRGQPVKSYAARNIFAYYDVTFTGNVRLKLILDEVDTRPNNGNTFYLDLSVREGRVQDKRRVYYPPLSYGYIPHFEQDLTASGKDGVLIDYQLAALPARFHKMERHHSEYQVSYDGEVQLAIYLDGVKLIEEPLKEQIVPQDGGIATYKGYFPADSIGQVLQYIQIGGDGEIVSFETDQTLLDLEAPQVEQPA
jgi:hypothetical protein